MTATNTGIFFDPIAEEITITTIREGNTVRNVYAKEDEGYDVLKAALDLADAIPNPVADLTAQVKQKAAEVAEANEQVKAKTEEAEAANEKAQEAIRVADTLMTNEQRVQYIDLYPTYEVGKAYKVDEKVKLDGKLFEVIQDHSSQADWAPASTPSLYREVKVAGTTASGAIIEDFKQPTGAHDAYAKGARVRYKGNVYESLIDANAYSPDTYPAGWKDVTNEVEG